MCNNCWDFCEHDKKEIQKKERERIINEFLVIIQEVAAGLKPAVISTWKLANMAARFLNKCKEELEKP